MATATNAPESGKPKRGARIRELARPAVIRAQRTLRILPRDFCLITGAPRSGTTALCQWLGQQQGVAVFEESRILVSMHRFIEETLRFRNLARDSAMMLDLARRLVMDYYLSSGVLLRSRLLVDKEPLEPVAFPAEDYEQFMVNVRRVLPESRVLLAIRDPVATIWSMSRRSWGESLTSADARRFTIEEHTENWRSCADLVARHCSDPGTYVVQFGHLVSNPDSESQSMLAFLGIGEGKPFRPRPTKGVGFSDEERAAILNQVSPQLDQLAARGISDL